MSTDDERSRLARWLLPGGQEPDPRFTLANERTFLAWIRTALAFLAAGIALEAFGSDVLDGTLRKVVSLIVVGVGLIIAVTAAARWRRVEMSLRHQSPLPAPAVLPVLALGTIVAAVVIASLVVR